MVASCFPSHSHFRAQEMADGQQSAPCFAATFFTDDIDDASVVSTFSASSNGQLERTPTSMTGETAAKAGFQGLVLSAEHTNIWRLGHQSGQTKLGRFINSRLKIQPGPHQGAMESIALYLALSSLVGLSHCFSSSEPYSDQTNMTIVSSASQCEIRMSPNHLGSPSKQEVQKVSQCVRTSVFYLLFNVFPVCNIRRTEESPHTGDKTLPFFESADAGCSGPQRAGRHTTNSTEETQAGQARQASHTVARHCVGMGGANTLGSMIHVGCWGPAL